MSVSTFTLPATVAAKAQGADILLDVNSFHPDAITAIFTYGARRWLQDHVNAQANTFAKAKAEAEAKGETFNGGQPFDVAACIESRIAQAVSGELSLRSGGSAQTFTDVENATYDLAVELKGSAGWKELATVWAASKGMATDDRKREVLRCVESLDAKRRDVILTHAAQAAQAKAALRAMTLEL